VRTERRRIGDRVRESGDPGVYALTLGSPGARPFLPAPPACSMPDGRRVALAAAAHALALAAVIWFGTAPLRQAGPSGAAEFALVFSPAEAPAQAAEHPVPPPPAAAPAAAQEPQPPSVPDPQAASPAPLPLPAAEHEVQTATALPLPPVPPAHPPPPRPAAHLARRGTGSGAPSPSLSVAERAEPATVAIASAGPTLIPPRPVAGMETDRPPVYPELARRRGEQGRVVLRVSVGPEGRPHEVAVGQSSGFETLDAAAADAVREWRFVPATEDGRPVAAVALVPIRFRLTD